MRIIFGIALLLTVSIAIDMGARPQKVKEMETKVLNRFANFFRNGFIASEIMQNAAKDGDSPETIKAKKCYLFARLKEFAFAAGGKRLERYLPEIFQAIAKDTAIEYGFTEDDLKGLMSDFAQDPCKYDHPV